MSKESTHSSYQKQYISDYPCDLSRDVDKDFLKKRVSPNKNNTLRSSFNESNEMILETASSITFTLKSPMYNHLSPIKFFSNSPKNLKILDKHFYNDDHTINSKFKPQIRSTVMNSQQFNNTINEPNPFLLNERNTYNCGKPPQFLTKLELGKKIKRKKIMKPITHIPLLEREIDISSEEKANNEKDFDISLKDFPEEEFKSENDFKNEIFDKELDEFNPPEKEVESTPQNCNFDDINLVYQNQIQEKNEKPNNLKLIETKKKILFVINQEARFSFEKNENNLNKPKLDFKKLKKHLKDLEEYEKMSSDNKWNDSISNSHKNCNCCLF